MDAFVSSKTIQTLSESFTGSSGKDGRFRPCLHTRTRQDIFEPPLDVVLKAPDNSTQTRCRWRPELAAAFFAAQSTPTPAITIPSLSNPLWSSLDTQAMVAMTPSAKTGLSLVNFVLELKDFRRLAQAFHNRTGILAETLGVSKLELKTLLRHPIRELSSAYLNYSFNWRPFVSDLLKIYSALASTQKRLQEIWRRQNKPQTRHYRWVIDNNLTTDWSSLAQGSQLNNVNVQPGDGSHHRLVVKTRYRYVDVPVYRATMRYTYSCPGALTIMSKINGWLDAFGVKLDASIIWNAIPFSFVVDWLVDVSGFLRRFSIDNLGLQVQIEDFCSSQKFYYLWEAYAVAQSSSNGLLPFVDGDRLLLTQQMIDSYERRCGLPNLRSALITSGLSNSEATLGFALLNSKRKYKR
jgi:hypothetical protein